MSDGGATADSSPVRGGGVLRADGRLDMLERSKSV